MGISYLRWQKLKDKLPFLNPILNKGESLFQKDICLAKLCVTTQISGVTFPFLMSILNAIVNSTQSKGLWFPLIFLMIWIFARSELLPGLYSCILPWRILENFIAEWIPLKYDWLISKGHLVLVFVSFSEITSLRSGFWQQRHFFIQLTRKDMLLPLTRSSHSNASETQLELFNRYKHRNESSDV